MSTPRANRIRARASDNVTPGFFATLGVPILEGRDFNDADRANSEKVVIVSQSLAQRMFPGQDPLNRHIVMDRSGNPVHQSEAARPRRIIGVVADVDDEHVVPGPALTVYQPWSRTVWRGRLFVHVHVNPYALVTPITQIIRQMSAEQVGGARRHARRRPRRGAHAGPFEYHRVQRIRGRRAADCRGRRGRRAGIFGQRTHARIRHPAGHRVPAQEPGDRRDRARRMDGGRGGSWSARLSGMRWRLWPAAISPTCGCPTPCLWSARRSSCWPPR